MFRMYLFQCHKTFYEFRSNIIAAVALPSPNNLCLKFRQRTEAISIPVGTKVLLRNPKYAVTFDFLFVSLEWAYRVRAYFVVIKEIS